MTSQLADVCMYAFLYYHREENLDQLAANYSSLYAGILSMGLDGIWTLKPLMNVSLWQQSYVYHNSMVYNQLIFCLSNAL